MRISVAAPGAPVADGGLAPVVREKPAIQRQLARERIAPGLAASSLDGAEEPERIKLFAADATAIWACAQIAPGADDGGVRDGSHD